MQGECTVEELAHCDIEAVKESWARVVRPWSAFVRGGRDIHRERLHGPAFLEACGDVRGLRVLDLGCGEGWSTRQLADRGATVTAIDVCAPMIDEARAHPAQLDRAIEYRCMDAIDLHRCQWSEPFDLVTACMSLQSMPDPAEALRAARQVLAPDGRLVCSVPHPITHMLGGRRAIREVDGVLYLRAGDYFRSAAYRVSWQFEGEDRWSTIRWSRPYGQYLNMLRAAGLLADVVTEPQLSCDEASENRRLRYAAELPHYLVLAAGIDPRPRPPD
jgi:2-polyprenyl-3-methyl-5-hydroxy-6-metoxy-1,4-benzoquinol methylase